MTPARSATDPDLGDARDQQRRERSLARDPGQVRADHHGAPRAPVGDDAADQQAGDQRERLAGEDEPDLRGRAAELEHRERERDVDHAVAEERGGLPDEEQAVVALVEDVEALWEAGHGRLRLVAARDSVRRSN